MDTMIAHTVATAQADKDLFRKALALEADWGLGRNPLNRSNVPELFRTVRTVLEALPGQIFLVETLSSIEYLSLYR